LNLILKGTKIFLLMLNFRVMNSIDGDVKPLLLLLRPLLWGRGVDDDVNGGFGLGFLLDRRAR
jgi:hypothetical protein